MKKTIILLLIMSMFLCNIVFATPSFYYKKGENIDLKIPCTNGGATCSGVAECNITVNFPNGQNMINNKLMTNQITFHNYTLNSSNTLGEYQCIMFCNDQGETGYTTFSFEVNNSGNKQSEGALLGVYIILIATIIGYLYAAFKIDQVHLDMKIVFLISGLLNMAGGLLIGVLSQTNNYLIYTIMDILLGLNILMILTSLYFYAASIFLKGSDDIEKM